MSWLFLHFYFFFWKNFKNIYFFYFKLIFFDFFLVFSNHFNVLISKIIFKKYKNIILIYFYTKNILKNINFVPPNTILISFDLLTLLSLYWCNKIEPDSCFWINLKKIYFFICFKLIFFFSIFRLFWCANIKNKF
jgi:hypothetical protein